MVSFENRCFYSALFYEICTHNNTKQRSAAFRSRGVGGLENLHYVGWFIPLSFPIRGLFPKTGKQ